MGDPYKVEPAKSNRSKCKACKNMIDKDELRFGSLNDAFGGDGTYAWRKITCITAKVAANVESKVGSYENVSGYEELTAAQQTDFRKAFEKAKGGAAAKAKAKGKAKAKDAAAPPARPKPEAKRGVKARGPPPKPMPSEKEQHDFLDAAKQFDFKTVRKLIEENVGYVNVQPAGRWSALHQAAEKGDADAIKFLLEKGASLTAKTKDGKTPLEVAKDAAIKKLLEPPPPKRGAAAADAPPAKRRAPPAAVDGKMTLYADTERPLEDVECEDLQEDPVSALPLDDAPKPAGDVAKRMKEALGEACLPGGESDGQGIVIVISNPTDDALATFIEALGIVEEAEDAKPAECIESNEKDWSACEFGFCYDEGDEDEEEEDGDRAKVKATTRIMADELTDHFEINFTDDIAVAPKLYGGYKNGSIVGVLSFRVWT